MSVTSPQIVFGYHGCTRWVAERIYSGEQNDLKPTDSKETYHWLGHGIYFWENAAERAAEWATKFGAKNLSKTHHGLTKKDLEPTVVGAIINLGKCLNLLDIGGHKTLQTVANKVHKHIDVLSGADFTNEPKWKHTLDNVIINVACTNDDGSSRFDTVRGCFPEGDALFSGSHILSKTHIQVCVRNPASIIGYFRPKNLDEIFESITNDEL